MGEFNVRSDSVDVDDIMRQIRARIREKRGADYTEQELQQLAQVKLERFIDPKGIRSDLVQQFRRHAATSPALPNFAFGEDTLYETHRGPVAALRKLLRPLLKLFFNPDRLTSALHIQSQVNEQAQERLARQEAREALTYEVIHNLTVEVTRLGIETHNLKMRVESLSSRLDFSERRARSMEGLTPGRPAPAQRPPSGRPPAAAAPTGSPAPGTPESAGPLGAPASGRPDAPAGSEDAAGGERRRRRRRRRRRPGQTLADRQASSGESADQDGPDADQDEPADRSDNGWSDEGAEAADAGDDRGASSSDDGPPDTSDSSDQ